MRRPSEAQVDRALNVLAAMGQRHAHIVLRRALQPRPVWPAKEVAMFLGVKPEQLRPGGMRNFDKFPAPAQELPRPTEATPDKTMRLWYQDQVEDFKRDYMRGGS
jgi:hypothetical protein